jgi:hypothetical protein
MTLSRAHNPTRFHERCGELYYLPHGRPKGEGQGRKVVLPWGAQPASWPVQAVKDWLERANANIKEGFLSRGVGRHVRIRPEGLHPDSVGGILKQMLGRPATTPPPTAGIRCGRDLPRRRRSTGPQS